MSLKKILKRRSEKALPEHLRSSWTLDQELQRQDSWFSEAEEKRSRRPKDSGKLGSDISNS